ncbi:hypothetical protein LP416_10445 [Polaromonas sp. P2-4]|nr:hypothetical protein LP416_10445 [Polaromonas sp. P2-4]
MRAVVVDDAVDVQLGGYRGVDLSQEREKFLYKRHGTTTLFAALNVLSGAVLAAAASPAWTTTTAKLPLP